jgi:hypothetical protein
MGKSQGSGADIAIQQTKCLIGLDSTSPLGLHPDEAISNKLLTSEQLKN